MVKLLQGIIDSFRKVTNPKAASPRAASPRAASPRATNPRAANPRAANSRAASPKASPQAPTPRATEKQPVPRGKHLEYAPNLDGDADPGEIVWTYVKYEDDPAQGKDRPVLVVGRSGRTLLGLMLSSQSERDGQRNWLGLGPGDWDRESRPSWIRLDRVLEIDQDGIRREGAVLDRGRFDRVAAVLRNDYGWQ